MTWVVASFINVIEVVEGNQTEFPVFEDFYLYQIVSDEELIDKINQEIKSINEAGAEGTRYYNQKAKLHCLGVRKVKSIMNANPELDIDEDPPTDGTELSHCYMTVKSLDDARLLAEGKAVMVHYIDDDQMDE